MKFVNAALRILLIVGVLHLTRIIATSVEDVPVTAPQLTAIVGIALSAKILFDATRVIARPAYWQYDAPTGAAMLGAPGIGRSLAMAVPPAEVERRARHEAGHAVVAHALGHEVHSASIVPLGSSGGRVIWWHQDPELGTRITEDHVAVGYAGMLAEGSGNAGLASPDGSDDCTRLFRDAISASLLDSENRAPGDILDTAMRTARSILAEHADAVDAITEALIATEGTHDLDADQVRDLLEPFEFLKLP